MAGTNIGSARVADQSSRTELANLIQASELFACIVSGLGRVRIVLAYDEV